MKRFFCCLALAVLPAPGQVPDRPIADLAIYCGFEHDPPAGVLQALEEETASILQPLSNSIEWRSLSGVRQGESARDLAVVRFKGDCNPSTPVPKRLEDRRLGWTHVSDGAILPFSDVSCDRVRTFLGREIRDLDAPRREAIFGRALGRVVAHELYHVLAHTARHETAGIASSSFTIGDLTADTLRFAETAGVPEDAVPDSRKVKEGRVLFEVSGCGTCHGGNGEGGANGPALRGARRLNVVSVEAKTGKKEGEMYRRARDLRIPLRSFNAEDTASVVAFLTSRAK